MLKFLATVATGSGEILIEVEKLKVSLSGRSILSYISTTASISGLVESTMCEDVFSSVDT